MPSLPARAHETETTPCVEATQLPMSRLRNPEPSRLMRQGAQTHSPRHLSIRVKKRSPKNYIADREIPRAGCPKQKSKSPLQHTKKNSEEKQIPTQAKVLSRGRRGSAPRPFPGSAEAGRARTRRGLSDRRCETSDRAGPLLLLLRGCRGAGQKESYAGWAVGKARQSILSEARTGGIIAKPAPAAGLGAMAAGNRAPGVLPDPASAQ